MLIIFKKLIVIKESMDFQYLAIFSYKKSNASQRWIFRTLFKPSCHYSFYPFLYERKNYRPSFAILLYSVALEIPNSLAATFLLPPDFSMACLMIAFSLLLMDSLSGKLEE